MKLRLFIITGTISMIFMLDGMPALAEKHPIGKSDKTTDDVNAQSQAKKAGGQSILAGCAEPSGKNYIEFNNVKALIHTGGDMFWDFGTGDPSYEVPKGQNKHSMFLSSLWLGGTDVNGQLRIAAQRYRGSGVDFWTGPLDTGGTAEISPEECAEWDEHFIISRAEVDQFVAWYNDPSSVEAGYTVPKSILEWPAHGDAAAGQSYYLAPFFDNNGDGFYNPEDGDYPFYDLSANTECNRSRDREPKLFGDQTMWFVFNDKGNVHNETEGDAIGLEVHAQEFAFATNDEINNMTFTNYRIINRSTFTLIDTYFGTNFDPDIGDYQDDYVGCDVKRGLGYGYNGPAIDGSGAFNHYGENPPAIGVDFFEGPFQDPDNTDNPMDVSCDAYMNGSINGLNFGDGEVDNERWGMRRLVFYCNPGVSGCNGSTQGDPETAVDYYSYLRGYWRDGTRMRYGGNGHVSNCTSCEYADFMFPGAQSSPQQTDECNWGVCSDPDGVNCGVPPGDLSPWTEQEAGNQANDRRFVHSAGPFTLEPGAENDITVGIIWARATSTNPFQSVELVRLADDKAQALFDNCFRVLNGPDAPELTHQELNREIVLYLSNPTISNNYLEQYIEKDPLIIPPDSFPGQEQGKEIDIYYHFQGYQIYQLKDASVSVSDIENVELARLVAQVDLKDTVDKLVNFEFNESVGADVPTLMVNGKNEGISHSFIVSEDLFALGDKKLVNHKKYYFLALAYAYNQYTVYTGSNSNPTGNGNKKPYLAGRKNGYGSSIEAITCIPHISEVEEAGTEINAKYGDSPPITRVEGQGNGGLVLDLAQQSINAIMAGEPWKAEKLVYQQNKGPVQVKVIDPLNVKGGTYYIKFFYDDDDAIQITNRNTLVPPAVGNQCFLGVEDDPRGTLAVGEKISISGSNASDATYTISRILFDTDGYWKIYTEEWIPDNAVPYGVIQPFYKWAIADGSGNTIATSEQAINVRSEQIIKDLGISVTIEQVMHPGPSASFPYNKDQPANFPLSANPDPMNGFLEATMTFADPNKAWLTGVFDNDAPGAQNWILSSDEAAYDLLDDDEVYENVIGGIWSPARLCETDTFGPIDGNMGGNTMANLASVNVIITADKSKWSRVPVIEMEIDPNYTQPLGVNTDKFDLRAGLSVDKNGQPLDTAGWANAGLNVDNFPISTNPNDANYIANTGMGWFPGYAINVETGERLNIMFAENSWLINGNDMIWNPTSHITNELGELAVEAGLGCVGCSPPNCGDYPLPACLPFWGGGRHWIYIMGHNGDDSSRTDNNGYPIIRNDLPSYDAGKHIHGLLKNDDKAFVRNDMMWVGMPLLEDGYDFDNPSQIPTDVTVRLRVAKPYTRNFSTDSSAAANPANGNNPMYSFNLDAYETRTDINEIAVENLDMIGIVPNPYYAFSAYETTQIDHRVKIINLPVKCTVTIYNLNGTMIRQFTRDDNTITSIDWDLKNSNNVPIASGMYMIHVNAPGIGEKVLKWFGVLRPIDLDSF